MNRETGLLDYAEIERLAKEVKPLILLAGFSAYPRNINYKEMRRIADSVGAVLMVVFRLAGITQGVLSGDVGGMLRRMVLDVPASVLGMVGLGLKRAQQPMAVVGKPIPDMTFKFFEGYEYDGNAQIQLSDLRGKVVILNVWASWCKPCEQEAAELQQFWELYKDRDVVLIGVDYVDTPAGAYTYMKKFKITFPNAPDLQSSISSILNRNMGVPETYFIDRDGVLRYVQIGPFASVEEIQLILGQRIDPALAR